MLKNFELQIVDAETRTVKAKTTIGERTYVEAAPGKEFWVTVRVLDMNMHNKLNPTGELNAGVTVDGKQLDFSQSFLHGATSVTFKDISGGRALTFTQPEQQWFNDIEDAKRAKEENKTSKVGVIEATIRQVLRTGEISYHNGSSSAAGECKVKATKKYIDQPNVGITGGRVISQPSATSAKVQTLTTFGKLEVYCQSALCIKMLKAQHDGVEFDADPEPEHEEVPAVPAVPAPALKKEVDGGVPVVKDEGGGALSSASSAAGKKRVVMEIDLTNDDSDSDSDDDDEDAASPSAAAAEANKRAKTSSASSSSSSSSSEEIALDFTN